MLNIKTKFIGALLLFFLGTTFTYACVLEYPDQYKLGTLQCTLNSEVQGIGEHCLDENCEYVFSKVVRESFRDKILTFRDPNNAEAESYRYMQNHLDFTIDYDGNLLMIINSRLLSNPRNLSGWIDAIDTLCEEDYSSAKNMLMQYLKSDEIKNLKYHGNVFSLSAHNTNTIKTSLNNQWHDCTTHEYEYADGWVLKKRVIRDYCVPIYPSHGCGAAKPGIKAFVLLKYSIFNPSELPLRYFVYSLYLVIIPILFIFIFVLQHKKINSRNTVSIVAQKIRESTRVLSVWRLILLTILTTGINLIFILKDPYLKFVLFIYIFTFIILYYGIIKKPGLNNFIDNFETDKTKRSSSFRMFRLIAKILVIISIIMFIVGFVLMIIYD